MTEGGSQLADLAPSLDPARLVVARYPTGWRPPRVVTGFSVVVDDGDEATLVCAEGELVDLDPPLESEPGWRRITFPGPLPWEAVGFLADVAGRLASAGIPLAAMAGFTTDHVLVREVHATAAVEVLRGNAGGAR